MDTHCTTNAVYLCMSGRNDESCVSEAPVAYENTLDENNREHTDKVNVNSNSNPESPDAAPYIDDALSGCPSYPRKTNNNNFEDLTKKSAALSPLFTPSASCRSSTVGSGLSPDLFSSLGSSNLSMDTISPPDGDAKPTKNTPNSFYFPTWCLLNRNQCTNSRDSASTKGVGLRLKCSKWERAHSEPPEGSRLKINQRSSTSTKRDSIYRRKSLDLEAKTGVVHNNTSQANSYVQDDLTKCRNVKIFGLLAEESPKCGEESHVADFSRQNTLNFAMQSARENRCRSVLSPMSLPHFAYLRMCNNQSVISRLKVLKHLQDMQLGTHTCQLPPSQCQMHHIKYTTPLKRSLCKLTLLSRGFSIAKEGKRKGNEDAFLGASDLLVVADGVGEWGTWGLNIGKYSRRLVELVGEKFRTVNRGFSQLVPKSSINSHLVASQLEAIKELHAKQKPLFGASTLLVAALDETGSRLGVSNLGDCALIVLRRPPRKIKRNIVKRTIESSHSFNCPKQILHCPEESDFDWMQEVGLGSVIPHLQDAFIIAERNNATVTSDSPLQGEFCEIPVQEGDLIVCGSDGIFDNLFDYEIAEIVTYAMSPYEESVSLNHSLTIDDKNYPDSHFTHWLKGRLGHPLTIEPPSFHLDENGNKRYYTCPEAIARSITEAALAKALDPVSQTPFVRNARRYGYNQYQGGKLDDMTCVVSWVIR